MRRYLKELERRKDLMLYLVSSGLRAQHRNTVLGYLWWLLDPLLSLVIYYFVVAVIFRRGGEDYVLNLVIGLTVWRWVNSTIGASVRSISSQAGVISQVYLPKAIFPFGTVISQTVNFTFGLAVVALFFLTYSHSPGWNALWLPYLVLIQILFMTAISLAVAFVGVLIRDMDNLVNHFMRLWFYASPVVWTSDIIPQRWHWLIQVNPMARFLLAYRDILLNDNGPNHRALLTIGVVSGFSIVLMTYYYSHNEHKLIKSL